MLDEFWRVASGKLAERWAAAVASATTFWAGVVVAWASRRGSARLHSVMDVISGRVGADQFAVLVWALVIVAASAAITQRLTSPALRLIEGYWPHFMRPLRDVLVSRVNARFAQASERQQQLASIVAGDGGQSATRRQREEFVHLDRVRRRAPGRDRRLPTRVGNTLRAAEDRPAEKYGLDAMTVWPHLWLLLPDSARSEVAGARAGLDASVGACLWGLLFTATFPWSGWAALAGPVIAITVYQLWVTARAEVFADLVESCFDLYRVSLYRQLRWPLPANPAEEKRAGRRLSTYLLRGFDDVTPVFVPDHPEEAPRSVGATNDPAGSVPGNATECVHRAAGDQRSPGTPGLPEQSSRTSG